MPGLRREEVAVLAGVSVPYYTRLERGDLAEASDSVLEALARALQLDDAERAHLFDLARAAQPVGQPPRRRPAKYRIRPSVQQVLDAMTCAGAHIGNDRLDILGANGIGRALFLKMFNGQQRPNAARFVFLDPRPRVLPRLGPHRPRQPRASSQAPTSLTNGGRVPHRHACDVSDQVASTLEPVRRGRGSEGCRSSSSRSLHHWDGWAGSYSSCQFHHAYGGIWG